MAKTKKLKPGVVEAVIGKEAADKIGTYKESTGGGTPLAKGEKLKDHPEAKRVQQPRDEEGKFTYNAVNRKPLKDGPSRGKTLPPFLKGNVKMKDVIDEKDVTIYDGKTYFASIKMTKEELIESCKEYIEGKGFKNIEDKKAEIKKGAKSSIEKAKIASKQEGLLNYDYMLGSAKEYIAANKNKKPIFIKKKEEVKENMEQPIAPKVESKVAPQPKQSGFDQKMAQENPKQFVEKNMDTLKQVKSLFPNVKISTIVALIGKGEVKDMDQLKTMAKNLG